MNGRASLSRSAFLLLAAAACGAPHAATPAAPTKLTPRDIVTRSKPAIVRIEAGGERIGTGFALDPSGVIATNLHVVAGAREIVVEMLDGTKYEVKRIDAIDLDRDLALIDIDPPKPVPVIALGDSDQVAAGDPVIAIGNPMGVLEYSVSDGLISSVRVLSERLTVLQISAPISQGSSGGPLFNASGEVIGVSTAILSGGQNLNFGVPGNYLKAMLAAKAPMSLDEFATQTAPPDPTVAVGNGVTIQRHVPNHPLSLLDGCNEAAMVDVFKGISDAIASGAPLYNAGNHEACYRIYEGTAIKFEREGGCVGVRAAFGDGLLRAGTVDSFTEKAWAMRDAFDGLLDVIERRAQAQQLHKP
ncbi:MAG: S1C family serine protease [Deltaproteobacteria bacterium]|nr:S1C family serine protease [Deltaproteobacteria bacterium]